MSWYPCPPHETLPDGSLLAQKVSSDQLEQDRAIETSPEPHPVWSSGHLKYIHHNIWSPKISQSVKEGTRRYRIHGVEVRDVPPGHFLFGTGQQGLFAVTKFSKYDVLGEYAGKIVGNDVSGHYVAALEDKAHADSLGIDAETHGNEMRFINSYLNINFGPNVTMRTVYINTYPHIVLVCTQDIDVGDELLLDYGDAYNRAYLTPKEVTPTDKIDMSVLPGCIEDNDCTEDGCCDYPA